MRAHKVGDLPRPRAGMSWPVLSLKVLSVMVSGPLAVVILLLLGVMLVCRYVSGEGKAVNQRCLYLKL